MDSLISSGDCNVDCTMIAVWGLGIHNYRRTIKLSDKPMLNVITSLYSPVVCEVKCIEL